MLNLNTSCEMPGHPRPILGIGAGGIVRDAHLPAYRVAGFEHIGLYDPNIDKARALAKQFDVQGVPTFIIVKDGQPAGRFQGLVSRGKLATMLEPFVEDGE